MEQAWRREKVIFRLGSRWCEHQGGVRLLTFRIPSATVYLTIMLRRIT